MHVSSLLVFTCCLTIIQCLPTRRNYTTKPRLQATSGVVKITSPIAKQVAEIKPEPFRDFLLFPKYSKFTVENIQKFLLYNGYGLNDTEFRTALTKKFKSLDELLSNDAMKRIIKLFQLYNNLPITGTYCTRTFTAMFNTPRCGFPDIKPAAFTLTTSLKKTNLTWKLLNYTNDLGEIKTRKSLEKAFKYWSDVAPLTFKEVCKDCKADIVISFQVGDHGCGDDGNFENLDILGHAYFPQEPRNGTLHFNSNITFSKNGFSGGPYNFRLLAAHEIGHILGIDHSHTTGSIMVAAYTNMIATLNHTDLNDDIDTFKLRNDDILAITTLYGRKPRTEATTIATTASTTTTTNKSGRKETTTTTNQHSKPLTTTATKSTTQTLTQKTTKEPHRTPCSNIRTLFQVNKNTVYALTNNEELWLYNFTSKNWMEQSLKQRFPLLDPLVIGGSKDENNRIWFFRGRLAYAYRGEKLLDSFPKFITQSLFPQSPKATVFKDGQFYVITDSIVFEFSTETLEVNYRHLLNFTELFPGIPPQPQAIINHDHVFFFFKHDKVYAFDERYGKIISQLTWPPCAHYFKPATLVGKTTPSRRRPNYDPNYAMFVKPGN